MTTIADPGCYETVDDDVFKWGNPSVAYATSALPGVTYAANDVGGIVPAAVGVAGAAACPAGQCEFVASAQGNIDSDPTNDEWVIASTGGVSTSAGNFSGGEPINTINDVNR